MHLADEVLDHLLGDVDVGDHAVTQRANRLDAVGGLAHHQLGVVADRLDPLDAVQRFDRDHRSEEHTSELQSLMRISYAAFCLKKKKTQTKQKTTDDLQHPNHHNKH